MLIIFKKKLFFRLFSFISIFLILLISFHSPVIASDNYEIGVAEIYVNPFGILQFGPIFGAGFRAGPNIMLGGHIRYTTLGALTWITHILDDEEPGMGNFAIGADMKYFFDNQRRSPHRFYLGGSIEYGKGTYTGEDSLEWEGKYTEVVLVGNFGHRWRFSSGFFLNAGIYLGIAKDLKNEWWYTNGISSINDEPKTTPFAMAEFTIGTEFK